MTEIFAWFNDLDIRTAMAFATFLVILAAFAAMLVLKRFLQPWVSDLTLRFGLPHETSGKLGRVLVITVWIVAALLVLDIWGVGIGGLWTVLVSTVTLVGVGFLATWTMISNFTASVFLTIWRPFRLGERVELLPENFGGRVIDRNLMFTALREEHGSILQVPNNLFFQKVFRVGNAMAPTAAESDSRRRQPAPAAPAE
jgi:small-conductance mechanosensitive channel